MIVSIAIAVLPVERSPMISSRCPRPIGMSASIARIDDASEHHFADRDGGYAARAPHLVAFLDILVRAHDDHADVILFEVEGYA